MEMLVERESCWSDEYLLSHCEGYRVVDEAGDTVGYVDRILWAEEPFGDPVGLVVCRTRCEEIVIPLERVVAIDSGVERIVVAGPSTPPGRTQPEQ